MGKSIALDSTPDEGVEPSTQEHHHAEATLFTVDGLPLAAGLQWSEVHSEAEAKKHVGNKRSYVVGNSATGGLVAGVAQREAARVGAYAAGMLIGVATPEALIYQVLPTDGLYWVCWITGGLPVADSDHVYLTEQEAKAKFTDVTSVMGVNVVRIGTRTGTAMSVEEAVAASLAKLQVGGTSAKARAKTLKPFQLQLNTFDWLKFSLYLSGLVVLGSVITAGLIYREQLSDRRKREEMLAQALQTRREAEAAQQRKAAAVQAFLSDVQRDRGRFGRQGVASSQWNACEDVRRSLPLSYYGYAPTKITCDFRKSEAEVAWTPLGRTTRLVDRRAIPGVIDPYSVTVPVLARKSLKVLDAGVPAVVLSPEAVRMAILDWGGIRLPSMRVDEPTSVVKTPPVDIAGEPGVFQIPLGMKANVSMRASGAAELLIAPSAMHMLDSYAVELEEIVWAQPTAASSSMQAKAVLYLPGPVN